jgi:hypothetical protein
MNNKEEMLSHGFQMLPQLIATSKKYTPFEKIVLAKVFDTMYMNKESREWKTTCFPSNPYLMHFCGVSEDTITRLKTKVQKARMFKIIRRHNNSDVWVFLGAPASMVKDYERLLAQWEKIKPKTAEEMAKKWSPLVAESSPLSADSGSARSGRESAGSVPKQTNRSRQRETDERSSTPPRSSHQINGNVSNKRRTRVPEDISTEQKQTINLFMTHFSYKFGIPYAKNDLYKIKPIDDPQELTTINRLIPLFFQDAVGDKYTHDSDHAFSVFIGNVALLKATYHNTVEHLTETTASFEENDKKLTKLLRQRAESLGQEFTADPVSDRWYDARGNLTNEAQEAIGFSTVEACELAAARRDHLRKVRGAA